MAERSTAVTIQEVVRFGGGSVMVWDRISIKDIVVINSWRFKSENVDNYILLTLMFILPRTFPKCKSKF